MFLPREARKTRPHPRTPRFSYRGKRVKLGLTLPERRVFVHGRAKEANSTTTASVVLPRHARCSEQCRPPLVLVAKLLFEGCC